MKVIATIILLSLFIGCRSNKPDLKIDNTAADETTKQIVVQNPANMGAVVKDNNTIVGATVESIEIIDSLNYKMVVSIQTAIPIGLSETVIEPGQIITVYSAYKVGDDNKVSTTDPINQSLLQLRTIKKKGFFIGYVSLLADFKYYLTSVETFSNPPEDSE